MKRDAERAWYISGQKLFIEHLETYGELVRAVRI